METSKAPSAFIAVIAAVTLLLAACAGQDHIDAPATDGESDAFITGGKSDGGLSECQVDHVLALVNDLNHGTDELVAAGINTRAARHIAAYRDGADGQPGTADDEVIDDLAELDAIRWVGPATLHQLQSAIGAACDGPKPEAFVIFSPQPRPESHLARIAALIRGAESSVDVAVYSFRDAEIEEALAAAVNRGVPVRVIMESAHDDSKDPEGSRSARFEEAGMDVRYVNKIMHHKFVIIDGPLDGLAAADTGWLVTGSANFSSSAGTRYDENTVFLRGSAETTLAFQREFNHLWDNARDFTAGVEFEPAEPAEITSIPDEPGVQSWFTSANFDVKQTRYGNTLTRVRGRQEVADQLVALVKSARHSIWIASGHMRSRPVAEAIIDRMQSDPTLDVRIYLDAQEYISHSRREQLRETLHQCLTEARTATQRANCMERGYYFSLDLHDAGAQVRMKWYSYRWHYSYAVQMHHKYIIVDGATVASGSYNLSANAEFNSIENMVFYQGPHYRELVERFIQNFETIWDTGQGKYEPLMHEIESGENDRIPIVFDPMALTHKQIADYRDATSTHCTDVNSYTFRRNPQRHYTCTRRQ